LLADFADAVTKAKAFGRIIVEKLNIGCVFF